MTAATTHATLDMAQKARQARQFAERKAEAAQRGKLRGIGYSTFVEACGLRRPPQRDRSARVSACGNRPRCG
jgi:CO/xanthine dehydrogenase Mo-binding subunit